MNSPGRLLRSWLNHLRLRDQVREVEWQLGLALRRSVQLVPARTGGGFDSIYFARTRRAPHRFVASVRINCPWKTTTPDEPLLPRRVLDGPARIRREATAYRRLAADGLTPRLLVQSSGWLANEWLPWIRVADVLRRDESALWTMLPAVLDSIRRMHELGVVHMDLNCGNLMLTPDAAAVTLIDFEYEPVAGLPENECRAFDLLRLVHNLLKPRRGRDEILRHPERFADLIRPALADTAGALLNRRAAVWFSRIAACPDLREPLCQAVSSPPVLMTGSTR